MTRLSGVDCKYVVYLYVCILNNIILPYNSSLFIRSNIVYLMVFKQYDIMLFQFLFSVPTASTNINVVYSSTLATATWSAVTGGPVGEEVTGYKIIIIIIIIVNGSPEEVSILVSADTLSYTFDNLNPETDYSIRISAVNANGEGPSSEVSFTTGNYIERTNNKTMILFIRVFVFYSCFAVYF